jgi:hypothetical protein
MSKVGTAQKIAKIASRILDDPKSSKDVRTIAASALTQSKNPAESTSKGVATIASKILREVVIARTLKRLLEVS